MPVPVLRQGEGVLYWTGGSPSSTSESEHVLDQMTGREERTRARRIMFRLRRAGEDYGRGHAGFRLWRAGPRMKRTR